MNEGGRPDGSHLARCYVDDYDRLLEEKVAKFSEMLAADHGSALPRVEAFASPKEHFRMRANFQMWHDDPKKKTPEGFFYAMYDENHKSVPMEVKCFPRGTQRINELMPLLMQAFHEVPVLFQHLFEVRFLTTKSQQALVVLLYKQPLQMGWQAAAEELAAKLSIKIIGRARKMKQLAGTNGSDDETVLEVLTAGGEEVRLFQTEGAFSQPNAMVCEKMIDWALDVTQGSKGTDLLELYCGGGTFTVPLSRAFRKVLATEVSKASVDLAKRAFAANGCTNIAMLRFSSEEFTAFHQQGTSFKRAEGVRLRDYDLRTVFVDPPRAGLDPGTCKLVAGFKSIVYISCNPLTLVRDLGELCKTHAIQRLAAFDQFPYTHHLECGVYLVKKEEVGDHKEEVSGEGAGEGVHGQKQEQEQGQEVKGDEEDEGNASKKPRID